jgi:uncharacterized membrane protein YukC
MIRFILALSFISAPLLAEECPALREAIENQKPSSWSSEGRLNKEERKEKKKAEKAKWKEKKKEKKRQHKEKKQKIKNDKKRI